MLYTVGNWVIYYFLPDAGEWHDSDNSLSYNIKVFVDLNWTSIVIVALRRLRFCFLTFCKCETYNLPTYLKHFCFIVVSYVM
jgi:hypothetical protein